MPELYSNVSSRITKYAKERVKIKMVSLCNLMSTNLLYEKNAIKNKLPNKRNILNLGENPIFINISSTIIQGCIKTNENIEMFL